MQEILAPNNREKGDAPREFLSPLGVNGRDVCPTLFPLCLPSLAAVERGAVEVRASERVELRFGEVQRRPELAGRRERIEIRCVDKRVVARVNPPPHERRFKSSWT